MRRNSHIAKQDGFPDSREYRAALKFVFGDRTMNASISYYTSIGARENNEDAVKVLKKGDGLLAIVADGLGGMNGGEFASSLALKEFESVIDPDRFSEDELERAVSKANAVVRSDRNNNEKMCTTLAALWILENKAISCYVGDSRVYQIRGGEIIFQSVDHSVSQIAVMVGEITKDEIRGHKDRNKLVRSIGAADEVKPQINTLDVKANDAFLLCSDGFWEMIVERDMVNYRAKSKNSREWLSSMREHIKDTVDDNNSAVAIIVKKWSRNDE